jgi:hypothetical protein
MRILYYGACWPTNIGNAFIDYGSLYTIKAASPKAIVHFASELPRWFFKNAHYNMQKSIDLAESMDIDYVVVSGMVFCDEFINVQGPILKTLSSRGVKIVFNGCGGGTYSKTEVDNFKKFLESIKVKGLVSRDTVSHDNFKDCCPKTYNGVDCAFFLAEAFKPASLTIKDYVVYAFDAIKEPRIENEKRIIRVHHEYFKKLPKKWLKHQDTLISDIPEDYLNLYANAYATYSDRVHACIAALSFGNFARLYSKTERALLFDRVGLGQIQEKLTQVDMKKLKDDKEKQIAFLREIFDED